MMKKVFDLIDDMTSERSEKFMENHNLLRQDTVKETVAEYNPKTARIRSLKDLPVFNEN
jgi:hypothetical protein